MYSLRGYAGELYVFTVAEVDSLVFQQDGAPAGFCAIVRSALDERFPGQWIGKGRPINWLPRNHDFNAHELLILGYI
jgi:hypothetical protein